jgi:hypothetical protein
MAGAERFGVGPWSWVKVMIPHFDPCSTHVSPCCTVLSCAVLCCALLCCPVLPCVTYVFCALQAQLGAGAHFAGLGQDVFFDLRETIQVLFVQAINGTATIHQVSGSGEGREGGRQEAGEGGRGGQE